jgi:hypothetical protein
MRDAFYDWWSQVRWDEDPGVHPSPQLAAELAWRAAREALLAEIEAERDRIVLTQPPVPVSRPMREQLTAHPEACLREFGAHVLDQLVQLIRERAGPCH